MIGKAFEEKRAATGGAAMFEGGRERDYKMPVNERTLGPELCSPKTQRPQSITDELVRLRDNVNYLHEIMTVLEQRTSMFSRPVPCQAEIEKEPKRQGSEVQNVLADQNDRLDVLKNRLNYAIDTLDV